MGKFAVATQQIYVTCFRSGREGKALRMVCRQEMKMASEWAFLSAQGWVYILQALGTQKYITNHVSIRSYCLLNSFPERYLITHLYSFVLLKKSARESYWKPWKSLLIKLKILILLHRKSDNFRFLSILKNFLQSFLRIYNWGLHFLPFSGILSSK